MTGDDYIKSLLVTVAWRDGQENGVNGCLGVMMAIRNRVTDGDWIDVIWDTLHYEDTMSIPQPDPRNPMFHELLLHVDGIYDGSTPDRLVDGATEYFGMVFQQGPNNFERVAQIGTLTFYRVKKGTHDGTL